MMFVYFAFVYKNCLFRFVRKIMATYQNDVHGSIVLGTGSGTATPNGSAQVPIRSHSATVLTDLIPITTAQQPKIASNVVGGFLLIYHFVR